MGPGVLTLAELGEANGTVLRASKTPEDSRAAHARLHKFAKDKPLLVGKEQNPRSEAMEPREKNPAGSFLGMWVFLEMRAPFSVGWKGSQTKMKMLVSTCAMEAPKKDLGRTGQCANTQE